MSGCHRQKQLRKAVVLALLLGSAPTGALAEKADALYEWGIVRFKEGRFEESQAILEQAAGIMSEGSLKAKIQLQLGVAAGVLKDEARAERAFRSALRLDPSLTLEQRRVKHQILGLFERVRAGLTGLVKVHGGQSGLAVLLDGKPLGRTPLEARVPVGRHRLEVLAEHGVLFKEELVVRPDEIRSLEVGYAAAGGGARHTPKKQRWPLFTLAAAGAAVAVATVGLGLGLSARSDFSEYETTKDPSRYEELKGSIPTRATGANVCFGIAGALAATSLVLYLLVDAPAKSEPSTASSFAPAPAKIRAGFSLRGLAFGYSF